MNNALSSPWFAFSSSTAVPCQMQSDCAAIPGAVCNTILAGCEVDVCMSDYDCIGLLNAACNPATGTCQVVACTSNSDCPAMELCNTSSGYCVDTDDSEGCKNMPCSAGNPCPCTGAICDFQQGTCG
jgi:hypothetical protein